ncbi:MAG: leucyl/phenylalanyl-tRNA--protein transferase [Pseudomonadota bacterium]
MSDRRLTPQLLLQGYAQGIFPMAEGRGDPDVFWVDPKRRGIFPLERFHISRSLARRIRRGDHRITLNAAFGDVVLACADREETWINEVIAGLYTDLHRLGYAHSIEVWDDAALIGGVYGVTLGAAFFGESMFSRADDGSKLALAYLMTHLSRTGFELFDTQFITPHLASLGAIEISRRAYHDRLNAALSQGANFRADVAPPTAQDVLQRRTQMS